MKKSTLILLLVLSLFIAAGCSGRSLQDPPEGIKMSYLQIDSEKAKTIMETEKDYVILDVRTEEEYAEGHIPNAVLIPDYEIRERAEAELPDKDMLILVYCRSGNRSKTASAVLVERGYTNVVEFGGIRSWPYDIVK